MSTPIVLDASALIALIYQEKGSDLVEKHLKNAVISSVNLAEVASYMMRQGVEIKAAIGFLEDLAILSIDFNESHAFLAASLISKTAPKGLSLGDRACLALAIQQNSLVLTADTVWGELDLEVKIKLIR